MKLKIVEFPDLVLQAMVKGLDVIMRNTHCGVMVQHSGDDDGETLGSGMRSSG